MRPSQRRSHPPWWQHRAHFARAGPDVFSDLQIGPIFRSRSDYVIAARPPPTTLRDHLTIGPANAARLWPARWRLCDSVTFTSSSFEETCR